MRRLPFVLLLLAVCVTLSPSVAAAGQRVLSCGLRVSSADMSSYPHLKCVVGTAVTVSAQGMRVRPIHGPVSRLQFTSKTRFQTNSGEGALTGLAIRDLVCVAYTSSEDSRIARIVAFNPRSMPCRSSTKSGSHPEGGGQD